MTRPSAATPAMALAADLRAPFAFDFMAIPPRPTGGPGMPLSAESGSALGPELKIPEPQRVDELRPGENADRDADVDDRDFVLDFGEPPCGPQQASRMRPADFSMGCRHDYGPKKRK